MIALLRSEIARMGLLIGRRSGAGEIQSGAGNLKKNPNPKLIIPFDCIKPAIDSSPLAFCSRN